MANKYTRITVSGKICTGKTTLYQVLGKKLGWEAFSTGQFFRDYAKTHALSIETAEEQNDTLTKKIDYQVQELLKTKKQIVVEGWMAGIMANSFPGILKVLLVCKDNVRSRRFAEREKVSLKEAKDRVRDRDTSWLKEIEKIYERSDIFDPKNYDLIIDTSSLSPNEILEKVLKELKS